MSVFKGQGLRSVGAYQVSGVPYVTGSNGLLSSFQEVKVSFPSVTRSITVINSGSTGTGQLLVHFNTAVSHGLQTGPDRIGDDAVTGSAAQHYITLANANDSMTFNCKCKEIYLTARHGTAGFEVFAELTGIPARSMFRLTGSGLTSSDTTYSSDME